MFYVGVVENIFDPLKLGGCQVRVNGLHNPDQTILPTDALPWFYPVQPITSAAMNGIGYAPVGIVQGTWCIVAFRDEDQQHGFIFGTLGGIPSDISELTNNVSNVPTAIIPPVTTTPVQTQSTTPIQQNLTPLQQTQPTGKPSLDINKYLTKEDINKLKQTIGGIESGGSYTVVNTLGYLGKYQFGAPALVDLGYVKKGTSNRGMANAASWNSGFSKTSFLGNPNVQEDAMDKFLALNFRRLVRLEVLGNDEVKDKRIIAGYLGVSHNQGPGSARKLKRGLDSKDGYGTSAASYYRKCYNCLSLDAIPQTNQNTTPITTQFSDTSSVSTGNTPTQDGIDNIGFHDPDNFYPLFTGEPDTHRLARAEKISETIVAEKDNLAVTDVDVAKSFSRGGGPGSEAELDDPGATEKFENDPTNQNPESWDQPKSPYNAKYPYNNVYCSQSGHLLEFDDTEDNERIHLYHRSGTFTEIDANGTQVNRIIGDHYEIVDRNGYINIRGSCNITVEGHSNILTKGNTNIESYGKINCYGHSDIAVDCSGNMSFNARGSFNVKASNITLESWYTPKTGTTPSAGGGQISIKGRKGVFVDTADEQIQIRAKKQVNILANEGDVTISSLATFLVNSASVVLNSGGFSLGSGAGSSSSPTMDWKVSSLNITADTCNLKGGGLNLQFGAIASSPHPKYWGTLTTPLTLPTVKQQKAPEQVAVGLTGMKVPPEKYTIPASKYSQPIPISMPDRIREDDMGYENQEEYSTNEVSPNYANEQISQGKMFEPGYEVVATGDNSTIADTGKTNNKNVTTALDGEHTLAKFNEFHSGTRLSPNFTLGDVIKSGHQLVDQQGFTVKQIVQNLKFMCENILEQIILHPEYDKTKIVISSGYRQIGVIANSAARSKHHEGLALDIQIKGGSRKDHYEFAIKLKEEFNIPFDMILLEYRGSTSVWIHVQCNITKSGNNLIMNNRGLWNTYLDDKLLNKTVNGVFLNGSKKFIYLK